MEHIQIYSAKIDGFKLKEKIYSFSFHDLIMDAYKVLEENQAHVPHFYDTVLEWHNIDGKNNFHNNDIAIIVSYFGEITIHIAGKHILHIDVHLLPIPIILGSNFNHISNNYQSTIISYSEERKLHQLIAIPTNDETKDKESRIDKHILLESPSKSLLEFINIALLRVIIPKLNK